MSEVSRAALLRMMPVLLLTIAVGFWINDVQSGGPYVLRNLIPLLILGLLATTALLRGGGRWAGAGARLLLGTVGFAIPALGLSSYLHYAYAVNLNELFSATEQPARVFQYLPIYTTVAGGIGFAIGWIVGRNA